jgi:hypothetical protein
MTGRTCVPMVSDHALAENEIRQFLLRRCYATSCTLQMMLKAAALVMVASGAVKFRMARAGSLGKGKRAWSWSHT